MDQDRGTDYLISFFVEDQVKTDYLSKIMKTREEKMDLLFLELPLDFRIPFSLQEIDGKKQIILDMDLNQDYTCTLNGKVCTHHQVRHGDYFVFQNKHRNYSVRVLLIQCSQES
ncbi:MAG: hypothetical protein HUJ54_14785, partial [Erysipelotrichaceae bacterium]|nr:hypothetical protein [Erysipelotrichaceae bacterium]